MDPNLLIGNLLCVFAMVSDSISTSRKTARGVLGVQTVSQLFYGTSILLLKGYSGAVQNGVSILRNLAALCKLNYKVVEWLLVAAGVVFGILFNNLGTIGWLPIIANLEYSLAVFRFKDDERSLKWAFLMNVVLFAVFNAVILNIVGTVSNIIVIILTALFLFRGRKGKDACKE